MLLLTGFVVCITFSLSKAISTKNELSFNFDLLNKNDWNGHYRVTQQDTSNKRLLLLEDPQAFPPLNGEASTCTQRIPTVFKQLCVDWDHENGFAFTFKSSANDVDYNDLKWYYGTPETAQQEHIKTNAKLSSNNMNQVSLRWNNNEHWLSNDVQAPLKPTRRRMISRDVRYKCYAYGEEEKMCVSFDGQSQLKVGFGFAAQKAEYDDAYAYNDDYNDDYDNEYYDKQYFDERDHQWKSVGVKGFKTPHFANNYYNDWSQYEPQMVNPMMNSQNANAYSQYDDYQNQWGQQQPQAMAQSMQIRNPRMPFAAQRNIYNNLDWNYYGYGGYYDGSSGGGGGNDWGGVDDEDRALDQMEKKAEHKVEKEMEGKFEKRMEHRFEKVAERDLDKKTNGMPMGDGDGGEGGGGGGGDVQSMISQAEKGQDWS